MYFMQNLSLTKIIATISPITDDEQTLQRLLEEGVRIFRINFSHGTYPEHEQTIQRLRKLAKEKNLIITICMDTRGPELRIEIINTSEMPVAKDQTITFSNIRKETEVFLNFPDFTKIPKGTKIYLDDGLLAIEVIEITQSSCTGKVLNSHRLKNNKKVSLPGTVFRSQSSIEKDKKDVEFAVENNIDIIFASFINMKEDVEDIKKWIGNKNIPIWSKIETLKGVHNLEEIIKVSEGIMIARGDLCVEMSHSEMFRAQKIITEKCKIANKPFIVATQLLESMISSIKPTRAEIVDVGSSVLDKADALLLSAETATGKHPPLVVQQMKGIISNAELYLSELPIDSHCCSLLGHKTKSSCVVVQTSSLQEVLFVYKSHSSIPIFIVSPNESFLSKLNLYRGIFPFHSDESISKAIEKIKNLHSLEKVFFLEYNKENCLKKFELF